MSRTISRRLLAQSPFAVFTEASSSSRLPLSCLRPFSSTPRRKAEKDEANAPPAPRPARPTVKFRPASNAPPVSPSLHPNADTTAKGGITSLATTFLTSIIDQNKSQRTQGKYDPNQSSDGTLMSLIGEEAADPHHFHIYAHRHNTHITVTRPDRSPLISVSAGNLGFRHAGGSIMIRRFQLAGYVLGRMKESGMIADIQRMEVVLRGFGAGREAVTKALLGSEGRFLRSKIVKVADATRLKFGGTRSKKPRRLG